MKVQHRKAAQAYCCLLLKRILLLAIFTERCSKRNNSSRLYRTKCFYRQTVLLWTRLRTNAHFHDRRHDSHKEFKQLIVWAAPVSVSSCIGDWEGVIQKGWRCKDLSQKEAELFLNLKKRKRIGNVFSSGCILTVHSSESLAELLQLILLDSSSASTVQKPLSYC